MRLQRRPWPVLLAVSLLVVGCQTEDQAQQGTNGRNGDNIGRNITDRAQSMQQELAQMQQRLNRIGSDIDSLRTIVAQRSGQAADATRETLTRLEQQRNTVRDQLLTLRSVTAERYQETKTDLSRSLDELQNDIENAKRELR